MVLAAIIYSMVLVTANGLLVSHFISQYLYLEMRKPRNSQVYIRNQAPKWWEALR